jgi:hypothetical protein
MSIELAREAPVEVEYWTEGSERLVVRSPSALSHVLQLARLRGGVRYNYLVRGTSETGSFVTEELPADLREIRFTATGNGTFPLVLVHLSTADRFHGYVILDRAGAVVWYYRTTGFPYGVARRANGNFVIMDDRVGLREVTPAGDVVATLAQDLAEREMHHDVIATPQNSLLFIAFETRPFNGVPLKGESIWEWFPETDRAEKRWSSWDFLSPSSDRGPRFGAEWMHANALSIGPRGNVLMSVHYFNQILSIAPGWGSIEWRLGGVNATVAVPAEDRFSGQHTAAEIAPGRVLLFDNGVERGGPSRALELMMAGSSAKQAWSWSPTTSNFASAVSSARRLPNGNTLVGFGMGDGVAGSRGGTEAFEVDAAGRVLWNLRVEGARIMFRAEPVESVAGEEG